MKAYLIGKKHAMKSYDNPKWAIELGIHEKKNIVNNVDGIFFSLLV